MSLDDELESARKIVRTDDYSMSLGELTNIYRDGELKINPSFQRLFRWSLHQKSAFFESILVGIPIPPIFVYELPNGHWELIDGLQRTSTLLEFQGLLNDHEGTPRSRSVLSATEYLPSLEGAVWDDTLVTDEDVEFDIGSSMRIDIKRSKIGVQILRKDSEERSKFDLFQRLNGNGSPLKPQEFRTCIMVMLSEEKFKECASAAADAAFRTVNNFSERGLEQQLDLDYLCNFIVLTQEMITSTYDVDEFITQSIKERFINSADLSHQLTLLKDTASLLLNDVGGNVLKRYRDGKFSGRTGKVAFETIFIGVARNYEYIMSRGDRANYLNDKIIEMWESDFPETVLGAGLSGTSRISKTVPYGESHFSN